MNGFFGVGATHIGKQRAFNEDAYLVNNQMGWFAVADGIGSDGSGSLASHYVIDEFNRRMENNVKKKVIIDQAHGTELLEQLSLALLSHQPPTLSASTLATTFTAFIIQNQKVGFILHAGDSRIYGLDSSNGLRALTGEHTLASELKRQGHLTIDISAHDALLNCIGRTRPEWHEVKPVQLQKYKAFLICSDGLNKMLDDRIIEQLVVENWKLENQCVERLLEAALQAGGRDNITTILISRK